MEAQSRGHHIHYLTKGEGEPLVLIHGLSQAIDRWVEAGYVDAFAGEYRVIAIDTLGHGKSDKPHDPACYLLPDVAADTVAVLDAEGVAAAHLWGYSRGGEIACLLATQFPDRVRSLIVGGSHIAPFPEAVWKATADTVPERAEALRRGDWDEFFRLWGLKQPGHGGGPQEGQRPRRDRGRARRRRPLRLAQLRPLASPGTHPRLRRRGRGAPQDPRDARHLAG